MVNYYRYLPISEGDQYWGLSILNAGSTRIPAHRDYPYRQHPSDHYFTWNKGRVLQEYQVIYIAGGEGSFESTHVPETAVPPGTVILLFPGEWHRFKPATRTGWDEYWVGFRGEVADNLVKRKFFDTSMALLPVGYSAAVVDLFSAIIDQTRTERPGYQPYAAGILLHLLGYVFSQTRQQSFGDTDGIKNKMEHAIMLLRSKIDEDVSIREIAEQLNVSYAWFRKWFKLYTGLAPQQYVIQLKMDKAKALLADSGNTIKGIAYQLRFEHPLYFSKLFKEKVGVSPESYRKNHANQC
ncbi:AraC family transcriptional regulator [Dinghuibacter silviterrae]|uniref:AraC-like DNA-binding protein n=1 Tax=Dinghuibacter silviterrae TaxID=1539049 RepID=A0A4R8DFK5_9BACT|nr:AraC family transcriptional regulator [Dinghuibacter silviterrae]TDW96371.1 AraC-like DNA-binding protein [Dinghuibacter silviterrae]